MFRRRTIVIAIGNLLLLDLRTGLAVADKVTLAIALAKGGASPGGVLELLEP